MTEFIVEWPDKPAKVVRDGWNVRIEWDFKQREEIVRCRDCAYRGWSEAGGHFCARGIGLTVEPDGFCKWGERRQA